MIINKLSQILILLFVISVITVSCSKWKKNNSTETVIKEIPAISSNKDTLTTSHNFAPENSLITCKIKVNQGDTSIINKLFSLYYAISVQTENFKNIKFLSEKNIKNYGFSKIYTCEFVDNAKKELSFSAIGEYCILINKTDLIATLLYMSHIQFIKNKNTDTSFFISGIYIYRSNGVFYIYDYDKTDKKFNAIFKSEEKCYIYDASDCIAYKNSVLEFSNTDLDNDKLLDLHFKGIKYTYCNEFESGFNKDSKKPIKSENISITYYQKKDTVGIWIKK